MLISNLLFQNNGLQNFLKKRKKERKKYTALFNLSPAWNSYKKFRLPN